MSSNATSKFSGVFPAVLTPFTEDLSVDYHVWEEYIDFLAKKKLGGLFLFGTNGEGLLLSLGEKKDLLRSTMEVVRGRVPILVQVGSLDFNEMKELVEFSKQMKVDGIVALAHFYYRLDDDGVLQYFKSVAGLAYPVPFFIYNIPRYTGNPVNTRLLMKLKEVASNLVGIKDSERSLENLMKYKMELGENFVVMTGTDSLIAPSAFMQIDGVVSAIADSLPELCVETFESGRSGNVERAWELQKRILKIRDITKSFSDSRAVLKYILVRRKVFRNSLVRFPLRNLAAKDFEILDMKLKILDDTAINDN